MTKKDKKKVLDLMGGFRFDGTGKERFKLFWKQILVSLLLIWIFPIGFAKAKIMKLEWLYGHTIVNGTRLQFKAKAVSLATKWTKWFFCMLFTLGFYGWKLSAESKKWRMAHVSADPKPVVNFYTVDQ